MDHSYWNFRELIPANKKELKDLLNYEIWMFCETCNQISLIDWVSKPKNTLEKFNRNLLLESLAIHTRILVDFFYNKKNEEKHPNDIIAQDLLPQSINWEIERPVKSDILDEANNKANKQLAHLSRWRIKIKKDGKKDWNFYAEIKKEMEKVIEKFENLK